MGLAPKSGAPQRVSAHVVPKAPAFTEDEEEKTTIESGWEEEASTTVEQGDVAERIRQLGALPKHAPPSARGNITSTNSLIDEPTVDDQHGNLAIAAALQAPALRARLVITHGSDTGQAIDVSPGKSYTIGRAIDNDFVLTDIAVSRKHFDLRHEGGSWLLADRGSGNGTIVNGQIEDQPFMLANGDVIEIGNTTFRFEQQQVARSGRANSNGTFDVDLDEEEPSTVAGKPVRPDEPMTPALLAPPVRARPKTIPPPLPRTRPATASVVPAFGRAATSAPIAQGLSPAGGTLQPRHHAPTHPPVSAPLAMPSASKQMAAMGPLGSHPSHSPPQPLPNVLPTTIPGQGMPVAPSQPQMLGIQQFPYPLASSSDMHHMHSGSGVMRDPTATAHVPPTPYSGMPQVASYSLGSTLTRKTKLVIGGAALTLFAAVITIAIIGGDDQPAVAKSESAKGSAAKLGDAKESDELPVKGGNDNALTPDDPEPAPKPDPKPPKPEVAKQDLVPTIVVPEKKPEPKVDPKPDPKPEKLAVERKPDPKPEKLERKPEPKPEKLAVERKPEPKPDPKPDPKPEKKPAKSGDLTAVKSKAEQLYRAKKFNEAAAALKSAAASADDADAKGLRSTAGIYEQLGRAYNVGMAPGTKKAEAFTALQTAQTMDRNAGGAFADEIKTKLAAVAPQAAIALAATKNYERAFLAVRVAESLGNRGSDTKMVRDILETAASKLYSEAAKEIDSSPDSAKTKLRQIKGMVESSSPTYAKANKLLNS